MSQQQASALAQPQPIPVLLGMESVYGMPPGYLVAFTLSERDRLLTHQHLHPAAVTTRPGHPWMPGCANQLAHYDLITLAPTDPYSLAYPGQVGRDCYSSVTAGIAASVPGAACHTPSSAFDLWNRILKPYTTRQIVPS